ncbi:hypothetical protein EJ06DRAFT_241262 [Trichodelitschia bisporula]|uniref:Uncharacterized protein n=1 Tax=Trichodelitschia bisporula TaxID=703511 RepID=A0A6G1HKV3_9PEZI|nr:hypothetical protein EJ06DRAFT_241262 [Trichodelitschia bisporula]
MKFTTLLLPVFAGLALAATSAPAPSPSDSCAAGKILGINAMCGNSPVDCGSGRCCLKGQKCVSGSKGVPACTDPDLKDDSGKGLTVSAACYGSPSTSSSKPTGTGSSTAKPTDSKSGTFTHTGSGPSHPTGGPGGPPSGPSHPGDGTPTPSFPGGASPSHSGPPGHGFPPYSFTNSSDTGSGASGTTGGDKGSKTGGVVQQTTNAAPRSVQMQAAALLAGVGAVAFWL